MSTITGLEGMLASKILEAPDDDIESEELNVSQVVEQGPKHALHGVSARGRKVVITTAKDRESSTQISAAGGLRSIEGYHLDLISAAMASATADTTLRYFGVVQSIARPMRTSRSAADIVSAGAKEAVKDLAYWNALKAFGFLTGETASFPAHRGEAPWLDEAKSDLVETLEDEAFASLNSEALGTLAEFGSAALTLAASLMVDAPAIDATHEGDLQIFWRNRAQGLLVVIRQNRTIHFFGSSDGESFRADYPLSGKTWHSHLRFYLQLLKSDAST